MRTRVTWLARVVVMVGLGILFAGAPSAQTTTKVDVRNFEVISVDGNKLVVRDERGTNELTVPNDFRFTVDGKKMSVSELKAGMKGTATVTTKTTIKPVVVTEIKEAVVLKAGPGAMTLRDEKGVTRRFTQDQLDEQGIQIMKDGRLIRIGQIHEGDVLTATIISRVEPTVVTEKDVQATTLAQAKAEPKAEPAPMQAATKADAPQPAPAAPPSPPPSAVPPPPPPSEATGLGMTWYVLIALLVAVVLFFVARRRKAPSNIPPTDAVLPRPHEHGGGMSVAEDRQRIRCEIF